MRSALLVIAGLLAAACGSSGGGQDIQSPYPTFTPAVKQSYTSKAADGTALIVTGSIVGEKQVGGKTFYVGQLGPCDATQGGVKVVGRMPDPDHLEIAEASFVAVKAKALGLPGSGSAVADAPVTVAVNPPVGEPQTLSVTGTVSLGQPGDASYKQQKITDSVTYTLIEKNVSVETAMGTVSGCNHYQGSATLTMLLPTPTQVTGELWYHPSIGVVRAKLSKPLDALETLLSSSSDAVDLGDGWFSVHKVASVGAGAASSWRLDTYDVAKQFDADKDTHAKMLLELRWADETNAKTDKKPFFGLSGEPEFGTVMGTFPSSLQPSTISIFHPEENGKGYHYWYALVDQAAKNESSNGIAYHIDAKYDASFSPVRATGRIIYKRIAGK